jgi:cell division protein FtsI/penicillin-binding protein 2
VVIAGGAALFYGDAKAPAASIEGAPLAQPAAPSQQTPEELAKLEAMGEAARLPEPGPQGAGNAPATVSQPQPLLGTLIDLDHITRDGDVYKAPLKDGRIATLTLDPELQELAETLLDQARAPKAAIVVMAPDGRLLALAGRRTEDPKGGKEGTFDWRLATDTWAPAASVFKLVTASALVTSGVTADDKVCFHGGVRSVMDSNLVDSKLDSRCESLAFGVAHSNNAILGKFAYQKLTPESLDAMTRTLGFVGALPGNEVPGNAGTAEIPKQRDLDFAKTSAGFENTQLSAAGGALLAATFADGGEQPTPRLIASIDGTPLPVPALRRVLPASAAAQVARMMVGTCENGSAAKSFHKGTVKVAGKTGTLARSEPYYMEHSWFVGFAPADHPQVIVSVLLGNPESWHLRGHEAAKRLVDRALREGKRAKS